MLKERVIATEDNTLKNLIIGFVLAILANISFYAWVFGEQWNWATGFPLYWLHICVSYLQIFFHEIGHTICMWFYGYPGVPTFDFQNGGGMTWMLTSVQQMPIVVMMWGVLAYAIWFFRGDIKAQLIFALFLIFNLTTFSFPIRHTMIAFMGHGFEPMIASFFLYRALFNDVRRVPLERMFNYFIGFGIFFHNFVFAAGLLKSTSYRLNYFNQKGAHGFGDFDKIAVTFSEIGFNGTVTIWLIMNVVLFILPFIFFWKHYRDYYGDFSDDNQKD